MSVANPVYFSIDKGGKVFSQVLKGLLMHLVRTTFVLGDDHVFATVALFAGVWE